NRGARRSARLDVQRASDAANRNPPHGRRARGVVNSGRMKSKKIFRPNSAAPGSRPPTHDQIEALAHAIWIDRGQPQGRELDNWLEAERQLNGDVRAPLAADDIPADANALDPDAS